MATTDNASAGASEQHSRKVSTLVRTVLESPGTTDTVTRLAAYTRDLPMLSTYHSHQRFE
jgi:hypothetical protein